MRQIPKDIQTTSDKRYNDILYGYLQSISQWDRPINIRYIPKGDINFIALAQELQVSRQTISKWFEGLKDVGLVKYNEDLRRYELALLKNDEGELIPQKTLHRVVNILSHNTVNTYIYLIKEFKRHEGQGFSFTVDELKEFCGMSRATRSNNWKITDILWTLELLDLIKYEVQTSKGTDGKIKSHYYLTYASKFLKEPKRSQVCAN